jgi:hypothetical protein
MLETPEKPWLRLVLVHFALIEDDHEPWRECSPRDVAWTCTVLDDGRRDGLLADRPS